MKIKLCNEGSMGSPGRQVLHCIGPQPPALWPPCSSPLSRSDWNASFAKYSLISRRWNPVCAWGPALPRSSSGATFQTFLMGGAHNHAGALKCWSRPIWKMKKRCGATCKSWRWTSLGRAGSGSTSITSHSCPPSPGLSKSYHLICRPDHWANAAMFSWGGVTYTITPQLVICILDIIAEKLLGLPKRNNVLIVLLYAFWKLKHETKNISEGVNNKVFF